MRLSLFRLCIAAVMGSVFSIVAHSQPFASSPSANGRAFVGETLVYDGKLDKFIDISVAELTFKSRTSTNSNELIIDAEAVSKGTLLRLFRYSFLQQYASTIDLSSFRILRTTKHDVQKERVRDGEAVFDYSERRVTYVESDPKDKMRPPRRIASEIGNTVYDMISAIYAVRLMPLAVGKKMELSVSDSGLLYKVPLSVVAREQQKSKLGRVWTLRVEPDIFGPGRLIEQKGKMKIWMTDDPRHIPVRAEIDTQFGKIEIKLKSYSKTS
jgi:hypothetical protein